MLAAPTAPVVGESATGAAVGMGIAVLAVAAVATVGAKVLGAAVEDEEAAPDINGSEESGMYPSCRL